jgi:hypothetical protein
MRGAADSRWPLPNANANFHAIKYVWIAVQWYCLIQSTSLVQMVRIPLPLYLLHSPHLASSSDDSRPMDLLFLNRPRFLNPPLASFSDDSSLWIYSFSIAHSFSIRPSPRLRTIRAYGFTLSQSPTLSQSAPRLVCGRFEPMDLLFLNRPLFLNPHLSPHQFTNHTHGS